MKKIDRSQRVKNREGFAAAVKYATEHGTPLAPITDNFRLAPIKPEAGTWYFAASCPHCGAQVPFFLDATRGAASPLTGMGRLLTTCFGCGQGAAVPASALRPVLWQ